MVFMGILRSLVVIPFNSEVVITNSCSIKPSKENFHKHPYLSSLDTSKNIAATCYQESHGLAFKHQLLEYKPSFINRLTIKMRESHNESRTLMIFEGGKMELEML